MCSANFCVDLWQASHQTFFHHPIPAEEAKLTQAFIIAQLYSYYVIIFTSYHRIIVSAKNIAYQGIYNSAVI